MNNFHCNTHANTFKQQLCVCGSEKQCNGGLKSITEKHGPAHQQHICCAKPEDLSSVPRSHVQRLHRVVLTCADTPCVCTPRHTSCAHTHTHTH